MPIYKIDGSETVVRYMTIYVEAESAEEAEKWASGIETWEHSPFCEIHSEEMVDGDITRVAKIHYDLGAKGHKAKWKDGVAVV